MLKKKKYIYSGKDSGMLTASFLYWVCVNFRMSISERTVRSEWNQSQLLESKGGHNHTEGILQESPRWGLLTCILCWYCICKELWDDPGVASPDTPSIRCEMKLLRDLRVEKTVVLFSKSSMALEMDRKLSAKHSEQSALLKRDPSLLWGNTKHKVFQFTG